MIQIKFKSDFDAVFVLRQNLGFVFSVLVKCA